MCVCACARDLSSLSPLGTLNVPAGIAWDHLSDCPSLVVRADADDDHLRAGGRALESRRRLPRLNNLISKLVMRLLVGIED